MKNYLSKSIAPLIIILFTISCSKKSNTSEGLVTPPVTTPISETKDAETPANVKPYVVDASGNLVNNFTTNSAPLGYQISFSDEFNATSVNLKKWNITVSDKSRAARDNGINSWFWRTENVSVSNGNLVLKASKTSSSSMNCGSIDSKGKYEEKFGYFEVRIDNADIAKAVHTAFWLQGTNQGNVNNSGNDGCEVDIFESAFTDGKRTQTVLHWDGYGVSTKAWTKHWNNAGNFGADIHNGYHIIGMEWTDVDMSFYYDGKKMFTYTGDGLPLVMEYLWLSVGASFGDGDFLKQPIGDLTTAKVDWVRVYTKN